MNRIRKRIISLIVTAAMTFSLGVFSSAAAQADDGLTIFLNPTEENEVTDPEILAMLNRGLLSRSFFDLSGGDSFSEKVTFVGSIWNLKEFMSLRFTLNLGSSPSKKVRLSISGVSNNTKIGATAYYYETINNKWYEEDITRTYTSVAMYRDLTFGTVAPYVNQLYIVFYRDTSSVNSFTYGVKQQS